MMTARMLISVLSLQVTRKRVCANIWLFNSFVTNVNVHLSKSSYEPCYVSLLLLLLPWAPAGTARGALCTHRNWQACYTLSEQTS